MATSKKIEALEAKVDQIIATLDVMTITIEGIETEITNVPSLASEAMRIEVMQQMAANMIEIRAAIKEGKKEQPKTRKAASSSKASNGNAFVKHPDLVNLTVMAFAHSKSFLQQMLSKYRDNEITKRVFPNIKEVLEMVTFKSTGNELIKEELKYLQGYAKKNEEIVKRAEVEMDRLNKDRLNRTTENAENEPSAVEDADDVAEAAEDEKKDS